jgi:hypothetical protein
MVFKHKITLLSVRPSRFDHTFRRDHSNYTSFSVLPGDLDVPDSSDPDVEFTMITPNVQTYRDSAQTDGAERMNVIGMSIAVPTSQTVEDVLGPGATELAANVPMVSPTPVPMARVLHGVKNYPTSTLTRTRAMMETASAYNEAKQANPDAVMTFLRVWDYMGLPAHERLWIQRDTRRPDRYFDVYKYIHHWDIKEKAWDLRIYKHAHRSIYFVSNKDGRSGDVSQTLLYLSEYFEPRHTPGPDWQDLVTFVRMARQLPTGSKIDTKWYGMWPNHNNVIRFRNSSGAGSSGAGSSAQSGGTGSSAQSGGAGPSRTPIATATTTTTPTPTVPDEEELCPICLDPVVRNTTIPYEDPDLSRCHVQCLRQMLDRNLRSHPTTRKIISMGNVRRIRQWASR